MPYCPSCGEEIEAANTFCGHCGADVSVITEAEAPPETSTQPVQPSSDGSPPQTAPSGPRSDGSSAIYGYPRRQVLVGGAAALALAGGGWYLLGDDGASGPYTNWLHEPDLSTLAEPVPDFGEYIEAPDSDLTVSYVDMSTLLEHEEDLSDSTSFNHFIDYIERPHLDVQIEDVDHYVGLSTVAREGQSQILSLEIFEARVDQAAIEEWWDPGDVETIETSYQGYDIYTRAETANQGWAFGDDQFILAETNEVRESGGGFQTVLETAIDVYRGQRQRATATDDDIATITDHVGAPPRLTAWPDRTTELGGGEFIADAESRSQIEQDTHRIERLLLLADETAVDETAIRDDYHFPNSAFEIEVSSRGRTVSIEYTLPNEMF